ncbi:unnamed protein product [Closterium sp. NIES-54]
MLPMFTLCFGGENWVRHELREPFWRAATNSSTSRHCVVASFCMLITLSARDGTHAPPQSGIFVSACVRITLRLHPRHGPRSTAAPHVPGAGGAPRVAARVAVPHGGHPAGGSVLRGEPVIDGFRPGEPVIDGFRSGEPVMDGFWPGEPRSDEAHLAAVSDELGFVNVVNTLPSLSMCAQIDSGSDCNAYTTRPLTTWHAHDNSVFDVCWLKVRGRVSGTGESERLCLPAPRIRRRPYLSRAARTRACHSPPRLSFPTVAADPSSLFAPSGLRRLIVVRFPAFTARRPSPPRDFLRSRWQLAPCNHVVSFLFVLCLLHHYPFPLASLHFFVYFVKMAVDRTASLSQVAPSYCGDSLPTCRHLCPSYSPFSTLPISVFLRQDGRRLVACSGDRTASCWQVAPSGSTRLAVLRGHGATVKCAAAHPINPGTCHLG